MLLALFVHILKFVPLFCQSTVKKYIPDGGTALATGHTVGSKSRDTITVELLFLSYHIVHAHKDD